MIYIHNAIWEVKLCDSLISDLCQGRSMGFVCVLHISAEFVKHAEHNELGHASLKCALQKI